MAHHKLSEGALAIIMSGGQIDEPVMQVLGSKKIIGNAEKERYRLLVSDGKYQISFAMIATQINEKITSGELSVNSVIKVKKFITSMINTGGKGDRRVMVILDMEILARGAEVGDKIGSPVALPDNPAELKKIRNGGTNGHQSTNGASSSSAPKPTATATPVAASPKPKAKVDMSMDTSIGAGTLTIPIVNLSPYANKWVIKVRITNKSPVRTWSNSRGEGKLFSVDLADESGEIRATAFRDLVDKFYDLLEVDKVFYLSKCQVKIANKKFCNFKCEYELTFTNESIVSPCFDEVCVPQATYNFIPIDKIANEEPGSIIDVLGVIKTVGDVLTIVARATNRELRKREVVLLDQSNTSITLTLWGDEAENFNATSPLVAIRGAKVGEFGGGKNLSTLVSSTLKMDPDMPEAHRLLGWYEQDGKTAEPVNISARSGGGSMKTDWFSILDVKERKLGSGDTPDYYQLKATVLLINSTNILYKACPQEQCNKKVIDLENGQYRCEKCVQEFENYKYRMIMSLNIADWSDNQWVSMFASEAEKVIGMTSQELGEQQESSKENLINICNNAHFKEYIFRCRAKLEAFNDETRLKTVAMRVDKINYKDYHNHLISSIKETLGIEL